MIDKPNFPKRNSIRLKDYDYSQNGAYFITVCTYQKKYLFGKIKKDNSTIIALNTAGKVAEQFWHDIRDHFPNVIIDEFVIMPNHVHGIIILNDINCRGTACRAPTAITERFGKPTKHSIPTIVRSYKSAVSKRLGEIYGHSIDHFWQRGYYEHVIRNDRDLFDIRQYIKHNPRQWEQDEYHPSNIAGKRVDLRSTPTKNDGNQVKCKFDGAAFRARCDMSLFYYRHVPGY